MRGQLRQSVPSGGGSARERNPLQYLTAHHGPILLSNAAKEILQRGVKEYSRRSKNVGERRYGPAPSSLSNHCVVKMEKRRYALNVARESFMRGRVYGHFRAPGCALRC
jgi:hypothetical protein